MAFYLLSEEVSKSVKVVQSGQGADEILAGYDWYPPLADVARDQTTDAYAKVFFDRGHADVLDLAFAPNTSQAKEIRAASSSVPTRRRRVPTPPSTRRCGWTPQVMLVDDPVKRVDTMTMAWGLEARVPFLDHDFVRTRGNVPVDLKLASGGKGVLKDASRHALPADVVDRTKGYFPVPGIRHLNGGLDMVRDSLTNDAARDRGLYRPETVAKLLAAPNDTRTTLGSNTLWQLAVLEMWLQSMQGSVR